MPRKPKSQDVDPATRAFSDGWLLVHQHPLFAPLARRAHIIRRRDNSCPADGWAVVVEHGHIHVHASRRGTAEEWAWVIAHALLHLGFDHFNVGEKSLDWNAACDVVVARFLAELKFGRPPADIEFEIGDLRADDENRLFRRFRDHGRPESLGNPGTAGAACGDMFWTTEPLNRRDAKAFTQAFAEGLVASVSSAVRVAGGYAKSLTSGEDVHTIAQRARRWFVNSYPLLGALAAAFTIIEDPQVCHRMDISVAAVSEELREVYINPAAVVTLEDAKFVVAHELLHVGLRHDTRRRGRDPYLWNVACDFVINGWLIEMGLGELPQFGGLHDKELHGLSADAIYDRLVTDLRRGRKLATLRGIGACDILPGARRGDDDGTTLDDFCRRALAQGLSYHQEQGRGLIPAGLLEEIRALERPPIPWDVELARWFDDHFIPREPRRTYARVSRRQSATPDIPRPRYVPQEEDASRTFAVVLDTSGSMDRSILAKALGTLASYAMARDVRRVRLVFCDAAAHDEGFVPVETIAQEVTVKGRGGTVLQPGIDLVQKAENFPPDGPILIITDGFCDRLTIRYEHAFLLPEGRSLPFVAKGPVFWVK